MKILLVEGRFYNDIADALLKSAVDEIKKDGFEYEIFSVSGALEIPQVINFASKTNLFTGYVALGCVMRGETYHFEVVSNESASGLMKLAIEKNLAIGNGIITVENEEQAKARTNKGSEAVKACIEVINIRNKLY
jgi:6,7-dimethyl-8-ribityllumazine synthase